MPTINPRTQPQYHSDGSNTSDAAADEMPNTESTNGQGLREYQTGQHGEQYPENSSANRSHRQTLDRAARTRFDSLSSTMASASDRCNRDAVDTPDSRNSTSTPQTHLNQHRIGQTRSRDEESTPASHRAVRARLDSMLPLIVNTPHPTINLGALSQSTVNNSTSPIDTHEFTAGLDRWITEETPLDEERQRAKELIMAAYTHGSHELTLSNLSLTSLPRELFQLTALQHLNLQGNFLAHLPAEIAQLTALETLDIFSNEVTQLPAEIGHLHALTSLNLSCNSLADLPTDIGKLSALKRLDLFNNELSSQLPTEIGHLSALEYLNLSCNHFTHLPAEVGQLSALNNLTLNFNQLSQLPADIGHLSALETLDVSGNRLVQLPAALGHLSALENLDLSSNALTQLPAEIGHLQALASLRLQHNQLTHLPSTLGQLTRLSHLEISLNRCESLPGEIGQLTALRRLHCDGNGFSSLPPELRHLTMLETFECNNNRLAYIDLHALPQNSALTINLQGNLFSSNTVQTLNQAQNQENYPGPRLSLSIVSAQQTDNLSAANIKEVLTTLEYDHSHDFWSALENRSDMGNVANDFTLLLAKIYNEAPRLNNRLTGRISGHIHRVLTTLEKLHKQAQQEPSKNNHIEELLSNAHDAVSTCVDRAAVHLLLMSAKSQYHQSNNPQAMADVKTIHATIDFVARLNKGDQRKLVFDNNSSRFKPFTEINHNHYKNFIIGDEVEDILKLLNTGLLKSIEGCDMRFEVCATLTEAKHLDAARQFILQSLPEQP